MSSQPTSDLEFLLAVETTPLLGVSPHREHAEGCACPAEMSAGAALVSHQGAAHFADPDEVTDRVRKRLHDGRPPWWLRTPEYRGRWFTAVSVAVAAVILLSTGNLIVTGLALVALWPTLAWGTAQLAAALARRSGAAQSNTVESDDLYRTPDLVVVAFTIAKVCRIRAARLREELGAVVAAQYAAEVDGHLFRAALAARTGNHLMVAAEHAGRNQVRPPEAFYDPACSPPRPRVELLRDSAGCYFDPVHHEVALALREAVEELSRACSLIGWHPVYGHVSEAASLSS